MNEITVAREDDLLYVGESPLLIINLKTQNNFIKMNNEMIPYPNDVLLSKDLLDGKRQQVFRTAIRYYYQQACEFAEGFKAAQAYRAKANTSIREIK